ncbi:MAG: hypothetical protein H6607_09150 [Flavobacteriales bacterium]|nr:hypothetical protein [Flavobacteriales bacterium]
MALKLETTHEQLRRNLGILGVSLPIILLIYSNFHPQPSISDFYYTNIGIVFTGVLIAFGLFLYSYRGYEKQKDEVISDNWLTNIAGILAIATALIPTQYVENPYSTWPPNGHNNETIGLIHLLCASGFFIIMGWMSMYRFTLSTDPAKKNRNRLYRICGIGVWVSLLFAGLSIKFDVLQVSKIDVFIYETAALWFFGTAWLIKGEALKKLGI